LDIEVWNLSGAWNLRFGISKKVVLPYTLGALLMFLALVLPTGEAEAQGILQGVSGYFEFVFNTSSTKFTDSSGNTVKLDSMIYTERLRLNVDTQIFPTLQLSAGGLVEGNLSETKVDGLKGKSKGLNFRPFVNLMWNSDPFTLGAGYNRREEMVKAGGGPRVTNIRDEYTGIFGWRPDGLPSLDVLYTRQHFYDEEREVRDITTDTVLLGLKYTYKNLDLRYQANYSKDIDKVAGLDTTDLTQTGRIAYSDSFLDNRISFNTSYNITRQDTTVISKGTGGEISTQIFPFAGLSIIFDVVPPETQHTVTLNPNPGLIDGNLTASAGINIGLPPVGGNTQPRHMGIDLLNVTEVNNLLIWVDRELPANIANFFSWDIYTSSDNLTWDFYRTIAPAPFGEQFQNRFELDFLAVQTRYIKVVTRPLAPTVIDASSFPNIFVTEIQAFVKKPVDASQRKTKTGITSQYFNADARARILNIPLLSYDFSIFYSRSDPLGVYQYNISNGLSVNHRFSQVFSGTARVRREDNIQPDQKIADYIYDASLTATPLRTLTHTLVFSGRNGTASGRIEGSRSLYGVFLNNTAQLYQGIDVYLNGGVNYAKRETGEKQSGTTVSFGSNIVPHRNLTFNLNFSNTTSDQKGGGRPETSSSARSVDMNASFTPFPTLYLYGSLNITSRTDAKTSYLQNYAVNWSPFPGGDLQLNFGYTESLRSEDNGRDTSYGPSLVWKITNRATLNMSYQIVNMKSASQKEEGQSFSARLQALF
jgi:hypothetical protein